ncbi:hypothetical protein M885DRAFT_519344 [Pelagophyceae sp. CCMP2097]|nr:hypothetical protein M885DRAFT_520521 [Pelagophyceae sp. CCMP2097]KAJ1455658.1 hypothetical protein M885DRAFT_519344 [Pelagophyceae sp. CCMP2097]
MLRALLAAAWLTGSAQGMSSFLRDAAAPRARPAAPRPPGRDGGGPPSVGPPSASLPFDLELKWAQVDAPAFVKHLFAAAPDQAARSLAALESGDSVLRVEAALSAAECDALKELATKDRVVLKRELLESTPGLIKLAALSQRFDAEATLSSATLHRTRGAVNFATPGCTVLVDLALSAPPDSGGEVFALFGRACTQLPRAQGDALVYSGDAVCGCSKSAFGENFSLVLAFDTDEDRLRRAQASPLASQPLPGSLFRKKRDKAAPAQWLSKEQAQRDLFRPVDGDDL